MSVLNEVEEILDLLYKHGWDERNGGNLSYIISEEETKSIADINMIKTTFDPSHRLVIHCHPTNVICMTHVCPLDSKFFTEKLWKMQTESIVVFPEGIGVLPWILCGGVEIGIETSKLMKEYRSVIWAQHGIFCTGRSLDKVFGLIETIEKAAEIYMKVFDKKIYQSISNENLIEIAKAFNIDYRHGIID